MAGNDPSLSVRSFNHPPARILPGLQAYYRALYEDRGGTTIRDLSSRNRAAATMNGTAAAWVPGDRDMAVHLPATGNSYLQFEDNLFDGATQGTIVVLVKAPSGFNVGLMSTLSMTVNGVTLRALSSGNKINLTTGVGGEGVWETLSASEGMVWDEWVVVGGEWGLQGKKIYIKGRQIAIDASKTGAASNGTPPYCGRDDGSFDEATFGAMLYWDRNLGAAEHRWLDQWLRYGH